MGIALINGTTWHPLLRWNYSISLSLSLVMVWINILTHRSVTPTQPCFWSSRSNTVEHEVQRNTNPNWTAVMCRSKWPCWVSSRPSVHSPYLKRWTYKTYICIYRDTQSPTTTALILLLCTNIIWSINKGIDLRYMRSQRLHIMLKLLLTIIAN